MESTRWLLLLLFLLKGLSSTNGSLDVMGFVVAMSSVVKFTLLSGLAMSVFSWTSGSLDAMALVVRFQLLSGLAMSLFSSS